MEWTIDELEFWAEVTLAGEVDASILNVGGLTLRCGDREWILDSIYTAINPAEDGLTLVEITYATDKEMFADCPWNLTVNDLADPGLTAEVYIEAEVNAFAVEYDMREGWLYWRKGLVEGEKIILTQE